MTRVVAVTSVEPNHRRGGDLRVLLSPRTVQSTSGFLGTLRLEPGEFVSEHYHPYSEEFLYVVAGSLMVRLDGEPVVVDQGSAIFVPIGVRHRVENTSPTSAEAVFQLAPLAPEPSLGHVDTEPPPDPDAAQPEVSR